MTALAVAIGGGVGALARYGLEGIVAPRQTSPFPLSTFLVNVMGSTALGALMALVLGGHLPGQWLAWGGTGFLGGFTTFSTFTYETARLIEDGAWGYATLNLLLSGPLSFAGAGVTYLLLR